MRDIVVKKVKMDAQSWSGNKSGSVYLVKIDHMEHRVEFEWVGGGSPDFNAFMNLVLTDRDIKAELRWALEKYHRKHTVTINAREGMSGCKDIRLLISKVQHEWAVGARREEIFHLHISCFGKLNEGIPDFFSGDLLELVGFICTHMGVNQLSNFIEHMKRKKGSTWESKCRYKYVAYRHIDCKPLTPICGSWKEVNETTSEVAR